MTTSNRIPKSVDIYAGEMLRKRRQELGLSQKDIAMKIGITFQQVQKYERGLNRIGASRLHDFCQILQVKPSFFFQEIEYDVPNSSVGRAVLQENLDGKEDEILTLVQSYRKIKSEEKRKLVLDIIRSYIDNQ